VLWASWVLCVSKALVYVDKNQPKAHGRSHAEFFYFSLVLSCWKHMLFSKLTFIKEAFSELTCMHKCSVCIYGTLYSH
jgi:hypothetical protein